MSVAKCNGCRRRPRKNDDPHEWAVRHAEESGHVTFYDESPDWDAWVAKLEEQKLGKRECVTQQIMRILIRQGVWSEEKYEVYPPLA